MRTMRLVLVGWTSVPFRTRLQRRDHRREHNWRPRAAVSRSGLCVPLVIFVAAALLAGCGAATESTRSVTPTPTLGPPTPTPTTQQRLTTRARQALGKQVQSSEATYDAKAQKLQVTGTLGGNVPLTSAQVAAAYGTTKALCFQVQRVVWTSGLTSTVPVREVLVVIQGPAFDDYADLYVTWYGVADLKSTTAAHLAWDSLSPEAAWTAYDSKVLRLRFQPAVVGIPPTDATPSPTP